MPIYEFLCEKCGHEFEELSRLAKRPAAKCPRCGAVRARKKFSRFAPAGGGEEGGDFDDAPACSGDPSACGRCQEED